MSLCLLFLSIKLNQIYFSGCTIILVIQVQAADGFYLLINSFYMLSAYPPLSTLLFGIV